MKSHISRRQFVRMTALMVGAAFSLPLLSVRAAETNTPLTTIPSDSNYKSHYVFNKTVSYFDLASKMTPVGDSWTGLGPDRLHLTPEGCELWASEMEALLSKLIAENP